MVRTVIFFKKGISVNENSGSLKKMYVINTRFKSTNSNASKFISINLFFEFIVYQVLTNYWAG